MLEETKEAPTEENSFRDLNENGKDSIGFSQSFKLPTSESIRALPKTSQEHVMAISAGPKHGRTKSDSSVIAYSKDYTSKTAYAGFSVEHTQAYRGMQDSQLKKNEALAEQYRQNVS